MLYYFVPYCIVLHYVALYCIVKALKQQLGDGRGKKRSDNVANHLQYYVLSLRVSYCYWSRSSCCLWTESPACHCDPEFLLLIHEFLLSLNRQPLLHWTASSYCHRPKTSCCLWAFFGGQRAVRLCCLMSSDVGRHIRDKLRPMRKHGSVLLYFHGNHKAR